MRIGRRSLRVSVASALLAAASIPFSAGTAHASPTIVCFASGHVSVTQESPTSNVWDWAIFGTGTCVGTLRGPYFTQVRGVGTSNGLGLCTNLIVQSLKLDVEVTLLSNATGNVTQVAEKWTAPITTFPLATPFLVFKNKQLDGAGNIDTRVRFNCPPGGLDTATFAWAQL